ncbi:UDP-forming cellulose synthase catalytic subunit [Sphingomonas sp. 3-13AW]|jgi:cellulose synthase (UDP-forming)|uniref:UDP-forming cellulose synthase catalytic subunit n=1 Tax=Sphingomonas sp. 3-13AW TaxID=3050450 RepID=UPI003BB636A0
MIEKTYSMSRLTRVVIAVPVLLAVIGVLTIPLDFRTQWIFAGTTIIGALLIGRNKSRQGTLAIAALSLLMSTRYLIWRTTTTLEFDSIPEMVLGVGLYLAELYAWVILVLGFLQTSWPLDRPVVAIEGEPSTWPMIDLYIPTYNESLEIVRNTAYAAMDMDYPRDRFRVFILDDGRRPEFRVMARQVGCGYLTRTDNLHAKAGNMNAALRKTDGELIAIFDCDHVPTRAFLQLSVGWFQKDPKLALLQTPHHFYSPDPVQRNLAGASDMPGEGDLFYGAVQRGNDLWNATFFCGSCAIIRREALMQTNGFAGETVTEDAHTALKLQRMGWNTAYIGARLSAGLATERLVLHIGQRIRWARGMTQIMRIDNPLFGPGLSWQQRLCYINAMLHFQFPLPRIVFLTSPLAYLIAGANIIHASAGLIFAYAIPHLFLAMQSSERIQGGERRPFWGEIYETLLAFHLVKPTVWTLFRPHEGKFNVTDKGSLLDRTYFDLTTVKPHLITIGLLLFGIAFGFVRHFIPGEFHVQMDTLLLNSAWATFSVVILLAAVSVARERRQTRTHIRLPVKLPVTVYLDDGYVLDGTTNDVSLGGLSLTLPEGVSLSGRTVTDVALPMGDDMLTLPVETMRSRGSNAFLRFPELSPDCVRLLVRAVMGRADAWQPAAPHPTVSGFRSLAHITTIGLGTLRNIFRREPKAVAPGTPAPLKAAAAIALALIGAASLRPEVARAQVAPESAEAAVAPAANGATRQVRLTLRDLQQRQPIRLASTHGEIGIPFGVRSDAVVTSAAMTLTFAHSPALLGDLSQMVVLVNGETVRTIPLVRETAAGTQLTFPVDAALFLPGENRLNLRFLGHYARDCEDPFHSSLWANVSHTRTYLDLVVQPLPLEPNLSRWPAPFVDRADPRALNLPFVFVNTPTAGELEAASTLASWFGSLASYRGFSFSPRYNQLPRGNAVLFLTNARRMGSFGTNIQGPSAAVVRNPTDPSGTLLLVMGRDDRELKQAAGALALSRGLAGGAFASFAGVRIPSMPRYSAPRWLRTDRPVKLGEFTQAYALQGQGLPPGPLTTSFRVAPDLFFWPRQGGDLRLRYRYPGAPWLDRQASRLDVSINNQYLGTQSLRGASWWRRILGDEAAESHTSTADVVLPEYNLFGQNQLVFDYNLIVADKKRCEGTLPDNVRVSILPDSTIDLGRAYHATRMPNLATFAGAGYPFTIRPDLGETVVMVGPNPAPETVEALLAVMGRFGDSTGAAATQVTVVTDGASDRASGKNVLMVGDLKLASGSLFSNAPVQYQNGRLQVRKSGPIMRAVQFVSPDSRDGDEQVEETLYSADSFTGIVSFQSPFDTDRTVVALLASNPVNLPQMVAGLADVDINAAVQGDLSIFTGDDMTSFAVGGRYWVGSLPIWMKAAYWFSQRPWLLALAGLLAAILLSWPAYFLLKRQERKRLQAVEK